MRRTSVACLMMSGAFALAMAPVAMAAEEHAAAQGGVMDFNLLQYIATVLVFLLALAVLSKTAWPKIVQGLEDRENKIRNEINSAEEARKRADDALKQYEKSLGEAKAEASRMIESTRADQARLAADLRVKAETEINELREGALRSIEAAKKAALSDVYAEAADLATRVASKVLEREVNAGDQKRLIEQSVKEFAGTYAAV